MLVDAVVLAGADAEQGMVPEGGLRSRAMVRIGDKTMLQWVVDALKSSTSVGKIIAVGDVAAQGVDETLRPEDSFLGNLIQGIEACEEGQPALVVSSDIPLLTGAAVDDFVNRAIEARADMCYPIIDKEACVSKYPKLKRTYVKTREGTFTGGNMMLLDLSFMRRNRSRIAAAYAARKNPLKLAAMIGFAALARVVVAQFLDPKALPVSSLEQAVSTMLGGKVVAIQSEYPEIGEDVDGLEDLKAVRSILAPASAGETTA